MNTPFPDVIRIESSGKCNFRCTHCPNGLSSPDRGVMPIDIFDHIIDDFNKHQYIPRVAVLYHGGEPLLNKNIFLFSRELCSLGTKKIKIVTNGSLLTDENIEKLTECGITEIEISFDGESPEENNSIRRNGNFYRDAQKVRHLAKRSNIDIVISNVRILKKKDLKSFVEGAPPRIYSIILQSLLIK